MLQTTVKQGGLINSAYNRWKSLYKHEDLGYMGAFLVQIRQAFKNNLAKISEDEEHEICQKIYEYFSILLVKISEINELYTQEHWMTLQADLLEQSYSMFSYLYKYSKNKRVIMPKSYENKGNQIFDPNSFMVRKISRDPVKYESIWQNAEIMQKITETLGYSLEYKLSSIDHPSIFLLHLLKGAGNGIFLKCKNKKYVLPGTLLGFFPGIVFDPWSMKFEKELKKDAEFPYLRRYDNFCIRFENVTLPYPVNQKLCIFP